LNYFLIEHQQLIDSTMSWLSTVCLALPLLLLWHAGTRPARAARALVTEDKSSKNSSFEFKKIEKETLTTLEGWKDGVYSFSLDDYATLSTDCGKALQQVGTSCDS